MRKKNEKSRVINHKLTIYIEQYRKKIDTRLPTYTSDVKQYLSVLSSTTVTIRLMNDLNLQTIKTKNGYIVAFLNRNTVQLYEQYLIKYFRA